MLFRKLKNRIYTFLQNCRLRFSYIDINAKIGKDVYLKGSEIHGLVNIGEGCKIHKTIISGNVSIGRFTSLWGPNIQILAINNSIEIGSFCSIARDVTIQEYFHNHQKLTTYFIGRNIFKKKIQDEIISKGTVKIGHDVWIGTGVQVLSGVTIGNGVVIAANSTVTKDIQPYSIVAGAPAKVIKMRFSDEIIERIESLQWWNWSLEKLKNNQHLFSGDIASVLIHIENE